MKTIFSLTASVPWEQAGADRQRCRASRNVDYLIGIGEATARRAYTRKDAQTHGKEVLP